MSTLAVDMADHDSTDRTILIIICICVICMKRKDKKFAWQKKKQL